VKPCKSREITFYEQAFAHHADFAEFMPSYFGTLSLTSPERKQAILDVQDTGSIEAILQSASRTEASVKNGVGIVHGEKITTEQAVVLENLVAGFVKPNILDVKLGARLWDEDSSLSKRERLDKLAAETTSASLGFRIAGMRVWQEASGSQEGGDVHGPKVFDKFYGRQFTAANVDTAFREFFLGSRVRNETPDSALEVVIQLCEAVVGQIMDVMEQQESRMVSASLLMVFEGDREVLEQRVGAAELQAREATVKRSNNSVAYENEDDNDTDDQDDDTEETVICRVRIIDFAHASWTPGLGQDVNMLIGIRNVHKILQNLYNSL